MTMRFESKVDRSGGPDACHWWAGTRDRQGYGRLGSKLAHRIAWELVHGPIPEGLCVCHRCDNPSCVNVRHLFLGTNQDNVDDREAKGRNKPVRGWRVGTSKLTEVQVVTIRRLYAAGGLSYSRVGLRFGVSVATVMAIVKRKTWAHVEESDTNLLNKTDPPKAR